MSSTLVRNDRNMNHEWGGDCEVAWGVVGLECELECDVVLIADAAQGGDGMIQEAELQQVLLRYHMPCSKEHATLWMEAIDADHNGALEFEEFAKFMVYASSLVFEETDIESSDMVFLGGSCNPTTWRHDVAIPLLRKNKVPFFNPQVEDWTPELMIQEQRAKTSCKVLLFVVDGMTRSVASMVEIAELISIGRKVVLVVNDIPDGTEVDGHKVTGRELKDLNRGRAYLADVADRHNIPAYKDVIHATFHAIKIIQNQEVDTHLMLRKRSGLSPGK